MTRKRLEILWVSHMPPSPPRFGAQARVHGLISNVARANDVTAVMLADPEFDIDECRRAMQKYCSEVALIPNGNGSMGMSKRLLQLRSLASRQSFDRFRLAAPTLQAALDERLSKKRFDVVNLEFPYLAHLKLRQAPAGARPPPIILDTHEIAYDLARQLARRDASVSRRIYGEINWRKLRSEERLAFSTADGLCACSVADQERLLADAPRARTVVIPNAADVEFYQPRPSDPPPDGRSVVFFGLLSTVPNVDGVEFLLREIWPRVARARPDARCKIIGKGASPAMNKLANAPGVEMVGFVEDLRPHLASAAAVVVPLRLGGGTRLKIVEGMAMGKAIVSTALGAEGIEAQNERDILIEDDPARFADAVIRLLGDRELQSRLGSQARKLAVERYSWSAAAEVLTGFFHEILAARGTPC